MTCTHLDVEAVLEKCSSTVERVEALEKKGKRLVCAECAGTNTLEICLECGTVWCREKGHVQAHLKTLWHKSFFTPSVGTVSCEECAVYVRVAEIEKLTVPSRVRIQKNFHKLNTNWIKGFLNLKRTCYVGSLLQSVLSLQAFLAHFLGGTHVMHLCTDTACVTCTLNRVIYQMYNSVNSYVDPSELVQIFWQKFSSFATGEHQDIHEYFSYLGQQIHAEEGSLSDTQCTCPFHRTFGGVLASNVICAQCGAVETSKEFFTSLSIDLSADSVPNGFERFFAEEKVVLEKACACTNQTEYTKSMSVLEVPPVLVVHLKRYQVQKKQVSKLDKVLPYPSTLTLNGTSFQLSSVVVHTGDTESGHYTAYTKRHSQWYLTNDEEIFRVSKVDVLDKPAYLIFYSVQEAEAGESTLANTHK
ncbi:ubiquitin carboxyl-terminal hydrolase 22/27/51 [Nematocida sp. AWRm77]|nr:ubiquitin carboxyl-terminal hydrolase 22/27/51 [Nematocida sp. AWRm77]